MPCRVLTHCPSSLEPRQSKWDTPPLIGCHFQELSAPVHAAGRRGCTPLLTLGCQKSRAPSCIFQQPGAPNGSYYSVEARLYSQRYLSGHRTQTAEAGPAGSRFGRLPRHLKYDRLLRRSGRFSGGVRSVEDLAVRHAPLQSQNAVQQQVVSQWQFVRD